jgi:hypothetical protein
MKSSERREIVVAKFYAGVGSRETPDWILELMYEIAVSLGNDGWTCRTGGADGADLAFEQGALKSLTEPDVYLPWKTFNDGKTKAPPRLSEPEVWTLEVAARYHPRWTSLSRPARQLHSRNVHQVLGDKAEPRHSAFVVCWTPEGKGGGGTGQAIRIARGYSIPVFDLAIREDRERIRSGLGLTG